MTQKGNLFKGQTKRKTIPSSRHGKTPHTRKGKRFVKPSKITKEMDADREVMFGIKEPARILTCHFGKELSKFINHCNEVKAASVASKEGGQLNIIKAESNPSSSAKK